MPWYRAGTVAVTTGQNTVTGTGTAFSANSRVGDAFQGPDGRWYEVTNIASEIVISIAPAYQGATATGGVYGLAPLQGYTKESADRLRQTVEQFGATLALLGTPSSPAQLRDNIGAASRGANSDITSLAGLTTPLSVAQGGTGGQPITVPNGGTGGNTAATARAGLGLKAAAVADVLGTVSQSGGVPTGAIFEKGSNANGSYVKRADGTMTFDIQVTTSSFSASGSLQVSNTVSITYPASFITTADVTIYGNDSVSAGMIVAGNSTSVSTANIIAYFPILVGQPVRTIRITVSGRWY